MKQIKIKVAFEDDYISRVAGEKLRQLIVAADQQGESVEIDFSDVIIASTSFFDEGVAKLALEGWDKKRLEATVIFKNMNENDRRVCNQMCAFRGLV